MTWHNLPCAPTLHAIATACPRGWIELSVQHVTGNSGFGGGDPQEPDTVIHDGRIWGVEKTDTADVEKLLKALWMDDELYTLARGVPDGGTILARIEQAPLRCNQCNGPCDEKTMCCSKYRENDDDPGCVGLAIIEIALVTTWGTDRKPVYTTAKDPDYTGQQPAPTPGRGDMWANLIRWAEGRHATPSLIERMKARRRLGIERYGTVLQADNGRDVVRDVLEETLDRMVYLEQLGHEKPVLWQTIKALLDHDLGVAELMDGIANGLVFA